MKTTNKPIPYNVSDIERFLNSAASCMFNAALVYNAILSSRSYDKIRGFGKYRKLMAELRDIANESVAAEDSLLFKKMFASAKRAAKNAKSKMLIGFNC